MEWCEELREEWKPEEQFRRGVRTAAVFLVFCLLVLTVFDPDSAGSLSGTGVAGSLGKLEGVKAEKYPAVRENEEVPEPPAGMKKYSPDAVEGKIRNPQISTPEEATYAAGNGAVGEGVSIVPSPVAGILPAEEEGDVVSSENMMISGTDPSGESMTEEMTPEKEDETASFHPAVPEMPSEDIATSEENDMPDAAQDDDVIAGGTTEARPEETPDGVPGGMITDSGFLIDGAGMICGVADLSAVVSDGCLELPSEGCSGISRGALAEIGSEVIEIYIPANISVIENGAFLGLDRVEWYEAEMGNAAYFTEDGVLFSADRTCIEAFPSGRTGGYPVPGTVERIAEDAFAGAQLDKLDTRGCTLLDTGNLPGSITVL